MKELDLKEKSSKSLLANVLDMDDDFVPSTHIHAHHNTNSQNNVNNVGNPTKNGGFIRWQKNCFLQFHKTFPIMTTPG